MLGNSVCGWRDGNGGGGGGGGGGAGGGVVGGLWCHPSERGTVDVYRTVIYWKTR